MYAYKVSKTLISHVYIYQLVPKRCVLFVISHLEKWQPTCLIWEMLYVIYVFMYVWNCTTVLQGVTSIATFFTIWSYIINWYISYIVLTYNNELSVVFWIESTIYIMETDK